MPGPAASSGTARPVSEGPAWRTIAAAGTGAAVRWAIGTATAAEIPLGAVAHLVAVAEDPPTASPLVLLRLAVDKLVRRPATGRFSSVSTMHTCSILSLQPSCSSWRCRWQGLVDEGEDHPEPTPGQPGAEQHGGGAGDDRAGADGDGLVFGTRAPGREPALVLAPGRFRLAASALPWLGTRQTDRRTVQPIMATVRSMASAAVSRERSPATRTRLDHYQAHGDEAVGLIPNVSRHLRASFLYE